MSVFRKTGRWNEGSREDCSGGQAKPARWLKLKAGRQTGRAAGTAPVEIASVG